MSDITALPAGHVARVCPACEKPFLVSEKEIARGRGKVCSQKCATRVAGLACAKKHPQAGAGNRNWKGGPKPKGFMTPEQLQTRADKLLKYALKMRWIPTTGTCAGCNRSGAVPTQPDVTHPLHLGWECLSGSGCKMENLSEE